MRLSERGARARELKDRAADPDTATDSAVDAEREIAELEEGEDGGRVRGRGRGRDGKGAGKEVNIPPETVEDLRPFPLNTFFRSESVLSEALRDEVYRRVVEAGQTVREVSQALSITMERVAAVVRLKTIENDWTREVSRFFPLFCFSLFFAILFHDFELACSFRARDPWISPPEGDHNKDLSAHEH